LNESAVAERLAELRTRIVAVATRSPVVVCAVTKGFGPEAWRVAQHVGCDVIAENYAQELLGKVAEVGASHPPVHFIGRLQTNKVRALAPHVSVWQSVDRLTLVQEIAKRAPGSRIYVQINATGETDKGGCMPADAAALVAASQHAGLVVEGLMTVGPTDGDPVRTRAAFAAVRRVADELGVQGCSMGMSGDLEIALEEGSTMVRVGTALFGERPSLQRHDGVL
jgi:pyridoxal phosphate enzyme (YggS family)